MAFTRLLRRLIRWLTADDTDETRDGTHETPTTPDEGGDSDNDTNVSQPPSRPETPTTDPSPPPADDDDSDDEVDLSGMTNPCVGDGRWQHAPPEPPRPDNPDATIEAKLWPERGRDATEVGCRMTAAHFEYVILDAWGDEGIDADVRVADRAVPEYVKDRAGFKEWARNETDEPAAEHINVHVGTDGPAGSACCGWGYVNVAGYFDGVTWGNGDCVKRRRWGPVGYGVSAIIHEALHCIDVSHEGEYAWLKRETVEIRGESHVPIMGTSYAGARDRDWHLIALHPENDQRPEL